MNGLLILFGSLLWLLLGSIVGDRIMIRFDPSESNFKQNFAVGLMLGPLGCLIIMIWIVSKMIEPTIYKIQNVVAKYFDSLGK